MDINKLMEINNYNSLKRIASQNTPENLVTELGFLKALDLVSQMLNNEEWDEALQEYATFLLKEIKRQYPNNWESSWKYEAFLGYAYHIILKYEECYCSYKKALEKVNSPPPQLLIALARCYNSPGIPPITEVEAIKLVKHAIEKIPYIEGVELLKGLYKSIGNKKEEHYWDAKFESLKINGEHLPPLDVL